MILTQALAGACVVFFMLGSLAIILGARRQGGFLLIAGLAAAVAAGMAPLLVNLRVGGSPTELLTGAAAIAGLLALAMQRARIGLALLWPAVSRWLIWPFLGPLLAANWILVALIVAPFSLFILVWMLQRLLTPIYGEDAAAHVTGHYLVRIIDGAGRMLGWLLLYPFRLIFGDGRRT
jgi:hypothetical protein